MKRTIALRRYAMRVGTMVRDRFGRVHKARIHERASEYRSMWCQAAERCEATFAEVATDLWRADRNGLTVFLRNQLVQLDDPVILAMAGRKALVHRLLQEADIPVPAHRVFTLDDIRPAMEFLGEHPAGVVVKPASGTAAGDGVTTHIQEDSELRRAAIRASLYDRQILIEEQVPGESYRALVVGGRMVHVVCRRGPRLVGDGQRTARALIDDANVLRVRAGADPIRVDRDCLFTLGQQGLAPDTVPPRGQEFLVRVVENPEGGSNEIRTVYNTTVTEEICDAIRSDVERAARVIGSDFLGVDLIMTDPSRPLPETGGCVNEVNTTPALHHHYGLPPDREPPLAEVVLALAFQRQACKERLGPTPQ